MQPCGFAAHGTWFIASPQYQRRSQRNGRQADCEGKTPGHRSPSGGKGRGSHANRGKIQANGRRRRPAVCSQPRPGLSNSVQGKRSFARAVLAWGCTSWFQASCCAAQSALRRASLSARPVRATCWNWLLPSAICVTPTLLFLTLQARFSCCPSKRSTWLSKAIRCCACASWRSWPVKCRALITPAQCHAG